MKHNETTEQNNNDNNNWQESQLAGGKPVGFLQVQLGSWTRDYQDKNPMSGQSGSWTRDPQISRQVP